MVRVRQGSSQRRTAVLSLIAAAAVACVTYAGWRVYRRDATQVGVQRTITDVTVTWECDTGVRFQAPGAYGPRPCDDGTHSADIVQRYNCPEHGAFECYVRYRRDVMGLSCLSEVRYGKGEWQAVADSIHCPTCKRPARPGNDVFRSARSGTGR
jgi:hypothetical protein